MASHRAFERHTELRRKSDGKLLAKARTLDYLAGQPGTQLGLMDAGQLCLALGRRRIEAHAKPVHLRRDFVASALIKLRLIRCGISTLTSSRAMP